MATSVTRTRRLSSLALSFALVVSIVPAILSLTATSARAAAGTLTNGSCVASVGETLTASIAQVGGTDCVVTFTSGSNSFTPPTGVREISLLVVAGGGAGGARAGGGGGAGGYVYLTNVSVTPGSASSLTVGAGGASKSGAPTSGTMPGNNGGNSTFALTSTTITANGGGGGGGGFGCTAAVGCAGVAGGSAGGSAGPIASALATQGSNNYGNGRDGAQGTNGGNANWSGGGGGGASAVGGAGSTNAANPPLTNGGNGGAGFANSITGAAVCYAAGGGGGIEATSTGSAGSGGTCSGVAGSPAGAGSKGVTTASSATANSGSGGGGSGFSATDTTVGGGNSGAGGSGVVIVRWTIPGNTGAFPDISGITARFNANNFNTTLNSGLGTWADSSGAGYHIAGANITTTNGSNITVGTTGSNANGVSKSFNAVTGTINNNINLLSTSQMPAKYTLFTIARYNSTSTASGTTNNNDRSRIFQGSSGNWLSGFWAGYSGVAFHAGWLTQSSADLHGNNWVLSSDCAYDSTPVTDSCSARYFSYGVDRTATTVADTAAHGLAINSFGAFPLEKSNFQIADVLVFNRVLSNSERVLVENYLALQYGLDTFPTNITPPTISGTTTVGNVLTANPGTFSSNPTSFAYQWSRSTTSGGTYTNISGATAQTYTPIDGDVNQYLKVTVTATNSIGSSPATTSAASTIIQPPNCSPTSDVTSVPGYTILTFTNITWCKWVPSGINSADVLIVGGGGAGGAGIGGGGGAGQLFELNSQSISGEILIKIGTGGVASSGVGGVGGNTLFSTITAIGGGGGGFNTSNPTASSKGSGGGGGFSTSGQSAISDAQGRANNGGAGSSGACATATGGGGGGAGGAGGAGTSTNGGGGGAGYSSLISGTSVMYAGGGGGGINALSPCISSGNAGAGGTGGGGAGGTKTSPYNGINATANTGSGGGGASNGSSGGNGADGVVVIKYFSSALSAPTGLSLTSAATSMALTWSAPANNGTIISDYLVEYQLKGGSWTSFPHTASATTSITVTGLNANSIYNFRVSAINGFGTGAASAVRSAITIPNLISYLDASDTNSYGGSGSAWSDLTGRNNGATSKNYAGSTITTTTPTYDPSGFFTLNGTSNYFDFETNSNLNFSSSTDKYTLNVLFSPSNASSAATQGIFSKWDNNIAGTYTLQIGGSTSKVGSYKNAAPWGVASGTKVINSGKYLATFVYDGTTQQISVYLNGLLEGTNTVAMGGTSSFSALLGAQRTNSTQITNFLSGKIYGVTVFNNALSAAQIAGLSAALQPSSKVSFDANGGSGTVADQSFTAGNTVTLNANTFTRGGYSFAGWATNADGTGTLYSNSAAQALYGDLYLYARWTALTYSVSYNATNSAFSGMTGGTAPSTQTGSALASVTLSNYASPPSGFSFLGWATSNGSTTVTYTNQQSVPITTNVTLTLFPVWGCVPTSTTLNGLTYLAFRNVGTCIWSVPTNVTSMDYLVVGGGGGGGTRHAGGGGAGGLLQGTATTSSITSLLVSVGAGGAGGDTAVSGLNYAQGNSGASSSITKSAGSGSFAPLSANGGGGGTTAGDAGFTGGSGGGALTTGGAGTSGQGNSGGNGFTNSSTYWGGGGGGGAGSAGSAATSGVAGNGGAGTTWLNSGFTTAIATSLSLTNTSNVNFAAGGGGGGTSGTAGTGGSSIGGNGTTSATDGGAGVANTGSGGGGGGLGASVPKGGRGGSGVVMLRYVSAVTITPTVSPTSIAYGSSTAITASFSQVPTYTLTTNPTCEIYSDVARTNKVSTNGSISAATTATLAAGTYYVNCSGAVATNGPTISYASDATFTINPATLTTITTPTLATTSSTAASLTATWTAVTNATSYTAKVYNSSGTTLLATLTNVTSPQVINSSNFASIAGGTGYRVTITAIGTGNYASANESSQSTSVTTLSTQAGISFVGSNAPLNTTITLSASGGSGTGAFSYSLAAGGTATGCSITGTSLTANAAGTCLVVATKAADSNFVVASTSNTTFTFTLAVPAAPTSISAVGGARQVTLTFAPGSDNGATISNYEYTFDGSGVWTAFSPTVTSSPVVVTGLNDGTAYNIRLRAVNAAGSGAQSNIGNATTLSACSGANNTTADPGYTIRTFTTTSSCAFTAPAGVTAADVVVVGGGGGGAGNWTSGLTSAGGGGGGGGVYSASAVPISGTVTIVVGAGGSGGTPGANRPGTEGGQGNQSAFGTITAGGGGGGGCAANIANRIVCTTASMQGGNGTAGGGGGGSTNYWQAYNWGAGGTGSPVTIGGTTYTAQNGFRGGYYNDGGSSIAGAGGPGGGARGAANFNTIGAGFTSSITGTSTTYGQGGATYGVSGWSFRSTTSGYGTGGDGAYSTTGALNGASGAQGVVIVRYANSNTYTYDLNGGGGTTPTGGTALTGSNITTAANTGITRTGYTFAGWNTAANGSGTPLAANSTVAMPASRFALVFYAQWTANPLSITYNTQGGSAISNGSTTTGASIASSPGTPTKSGSAFAGWFAASSGGSAITFPYAHNQTADFTLFAQWTSCGSSVVQSGLLLHLDAGNSCSTTGSTTSWVDISTSGNNATLVSSPTYNSSTGSFYSFATSGQHGTLPTGFANFSSGFSISFYARFPSVIGTWERIIDFGNGSANNNIWVGRVGNSSEIGIEFFNGGTSLGICQTDTSAIVGNAWAHFAFTVDTTNGCRIYKNGVLIKTLSTYRTMPNNITRTINYIARSNWAADSYFMGAIGDLAIYNSSLTAADIRSNYAAQADAVYTVTYDGNNSTSGTVPSDSTSPYLNGATVTVLANTGSLARTGYTYSGWNTSAGGTGTDRAATGSVTFTISSANVILYAKWSGNQYVYNANTGTGTTATQTFAGSALTAQTNAFTAPIGYSFGGWCTTQPAVGAACTGTSYAAGATLPTPASATVTLYAIWSAASQSITYNNNGGAGTISATTGNTGTTVALSDGNSFTRSGYTLSRWDTAAAGTGTSYTLSQSAVTMPAGGLALYAIWTGNQYIYNANTGTGSMSAQSFAGSALSASTNTFTPPNNYAFDGWCSSSLSVGATCSGTKYSAGATLPTPTSATVTLYAIWKLNSFTITYSAATATSGSPSIATASYTVGNPGLTLATVGTMMKTGHTFAGWSTISGNAADLTSPYVLTQDITVYAAWTVDTYNVSFDSRSGSAVSAGTFTYGGAVTAPTAPTRTGYTFSGWFIATSGGTALTFPYSPGGTSDITLYAQWTPINYIIAYVRNGGTGTAPTESTKNIGNTFIVADIGAVTRTGYNFAGWNDGTTTYQPGDTYTVGSSNVTLTAQWNIAVYTITYNANNGTGSASRTSENYTYGSSAINLPTVGTLARVGYTFSGWSESTSGAAISGAYTPTQTRTLYAVWSANTYAISYNINGAGGTGPANDSYTTAGATLTLPGVGSMTKTGYDFGGWATTAGGSAISNSEFTTTSDITLYAVWTIKTITVTYSAGLAGGAAPNPTLTNFPTNTSGTYGTNITISSTIDSYANNNNYAFAGWSDGTSIYNKGDTYRLQDAPLTLTAQWIAIYAVRYSLGGGTLAPGTFTYDSECVADVVEQKCTNNQAITANASPSRTGYTFAGWIDQSGNPISQAANGWTITSTSYLAFASWAPIPYQITYDSAGGTTAPTENAKNIGDFITVKPAVSRTGYTFNGWVSNGITYGPGATIQVGSSDITFTASWTAINYTASYDLNGGTSAVPATVTTTYLANVSVAAAPTRPGYTFNDWNDGSAVVTASSTYGMPAHNVTFTAQWNAIDYSVSYNSNGGSTAPTGSTGRHIGDTFTVGAAVTLAGRLFLGWSDGINTYNPGQPYVVQTSNVSFTAVWSGQLYTITYQANGGAGTPPTEGDHLVNDSFFVASGSSLTRSGYTFSGWLSGGQSYQPNDIFTVGTSNITFAAIWSKNSITITFDANGGSPASATQSLTADTATNLATNSFTRNDYTFSGWTINSDGTGSQFANGQSITFLESKTLFAKWIPAFVVTFNSNGGSAVTALTYTGTALAKPSDPTRSGYTFTGWSNGTSNVSWSYSPSGSITLTAQWNANTLNISYDAQGGGTPNGGVSTTLTDATLSTLPSTSRAGYDFNGWFTLPSGGTQITPGSGHGKTSNFTLHAQWSARTLNIAYNGNGAGVTGVSGGPATTLTDGTLTSLPTPARPGYTFNGWFTQNSGGSQITTSSGHAQTADFTLYAQWSANSYAITLDKNDGSNSTITQTNVVADQATPLNTASSLALSRQYFAFDGWSENADGSGATYADGDNITILGAKTLYAKWRATNYIVTYAAGTNASAPRASDNYAIGGQNLTLPLPTRANFTFDGWYDSLTNENGRVNGSGNKVGDAGGAYTPSLNRTLHARWIQTSLYGVNENALTNLGNVQASATLGTGIFASVGNSSVQVTVPAGSLPNGTAVSAKLVGDFSRASGLLANTNNVILSMVVSWLAPDETVPDTAAGLPLRMVVEHPDIRPGSAIYSILGSSVTLLGRATETGRATFYLQTDPELVIAATEPDAPTSVSATPGNAQATVSWSAAVDGGSAITGYRVTSSGGQICTTTGALSCTINGLTNGTAYTFTVVAINNQGESAPSSASLAITPRTIPGAPTSVTATPGNSQVTLSWSAPLTNGGAAITGYTVTSSPSIAAPADCANTTNLSCTFSGLSNGTSYTFTVVAINEAGSSLASTASAAITPRTIPGAPTSVNATPDNSQALISWTAPTSNGGSIITSYTVTSSPGALTCTTSGATSCAVIGLINGTAYTFTVVAANVAGSSSTSVASAAVTPRTIPSAPTSVSAAFGNAQAVVTWQAPGSNGGSVITGYNVTSSPAVSSPVGCTNINALTCTFTGLNNGTSYTFTVVAINIAGESPASSPSSAITPRTVPGAPTNVVTTPGDTQVILTWSAPTSDGGSAITGYSVTSSPSVTAPAGCTNINALTCTFTGLTNGTAYTFTVVAINSAGTVAADPTAAVTPRTLPDAPTSVTAVAGNARATLSWSAPTSDGGATITGYTVTSSPAVTASADCTNTANLTCTFSGLVNGTAYTFTVVATNVAGPSNSSLASAAVTPLTVPDAPTGITTTAGDGEIALTWIAPTVDGGSAITGYSVIATPTATAPTACLNTTSLSCTFTGLTNGTAYTFTIIAINNAGNSLESTPSAATTPRTIPDAPTGIVGTSGNAQITLSWSAPTFNGGSPITNYRVESLPLVAAPVGCTTTTSLTCLFTGLINGVAYTFTVIATNIAGDSLASAPSAAITPAVPPTPPAAANNLTLPEEKNDESDDLREPIEELDPIVVVVPAEPITENADGVSILPAVGTTGATNTMINGKVIGEFMQVIDSKQFVAQAGPIQIQIVSRNSTAQALDIPSVSQLVLEHDGRAEIAGSGFKEQTIVKIWLFSTPTFLGEFPVDASGSFNAALLVMNSLPVGQHTLQINGVTPDNRIFSQSLPVTVKAKTSATVKKQVKRVIPPISGTILGTTANSVTFGFTAITQAVKYRVFVTNMDSGRLVRAVEVSKVRVVLANLLNGTRYALAIIAYDSANKQLARTSGTGLTFTTLVQNPVRPKITILCSLPGRSIRVIGVNPKCPTGYSSEENFAPLGAIISKIGRN